MDFFIIIFLYLNFFYFCYTFESCEISLSPSEDFALKLDKEEGFEEQVTFYAKVSEPVEEVLFFVYRDKEFSKIRVKCLPKDDNLEKNFPIDLEKIKFNDFNSSLDLDGDLNNVIISNISLINQLFKNNLNLLKKYKNKWKSRKRNRLNETEESGKHDKNKCSFFQHTQTFKRVGWYKIGAKAFWSYSPNITVEVQTPILNSSLHFPPSLSNSSLSFYSSLSFLELKVTTSQGTSPSYNWSVDGLFVESNISDPSILTYFFKNSGLHKINVNVSNRVSNQTVSRQLVIQEPIIEIKIKCNTSFISPNQSFNCSVSMTPPGEFQVQNFMWILQKLDTSVLKKERKCSNSGICERGELILSHFAPLTHNSQNPFFSTNQINQIGSFLLEVTGFNFLSNKSSQNKWKLESIQPLSKLKISSDHYPSLHSPISFSASTNPTSYCSFTWMFGDGLDPITTNSSSIKYQYNKTGSFFVTLVATNPISLKNTSIQIFVSDGKCRSPLVSFVDETDKLNPKLIFLKEVDFEIEVLTGIDCDHPQSLTHNLSIFSNSSSKLVYSKQSSESTIIIPSFTLLPQSYYAIVNTSVDNSFMYSVTKTSLYFRVKEFKPSLSINGGFQRSIGPSSLVSMTAIIDNKEDYNWKWSCTDYHSNELVSCFLTDQLHLDQFSFYFNSSNLNPNHVFTDGYLFKVEATSPNHQLTAHQLITFQTRGSLNTLIDCHDCVKDQVNKEDFLTLEAKVEIPEREEFEGGGEKYYNFSYLWTLSDMDSQNIEYQITSQKTCVFPNGTVSLLHSLIKTPRVRKNFTSLLSIPFFPPTPYWNSSIPLKPHNPLDPNENKFKPGRKSNNLPTFFEDNKESKGSELEETIFYPPKLESKTHTSLIKNLTRGFRQERTLFEREVVGGRFDKKYLKLMPYVLQPSIVYIVNLSVVDSKSGRSGWSLRHIKVNSPPHEGLCSFVPSYTKQLTAFRDFLSISCLNWLSQSNFLSYYVTLRVPGFLQRPFTAYEGRYKNFNFTLPPGHPSFNYTVSVEVEITDTKGASTGVCGVNYTVLPPHNFETLDFLKMYEILSKKTSKRQTMLWNSFTNLGLSFLDFSYSNFTVSPKFSTKFPSTSPSSSFSSSFSQNLPLSSKFSSFKNMASNSSFEEFRDVVLEKNLDILQEKNLETMFDAELALVLIETTLKNFKSLQTNQSEIIINIFTKIINLFDFQQKKLKPSLVDMATDLVPKLFEFIFLNESHMTRKENCGGVWPISFSETDVHLCNQLVDQLINSTHTLVFLKTKLGQVNDFLMNLDLFYSSDNLVLYGFHFSRNNSEDLEKELNRLKVIFPSSFFSDLQEGLVKRQVPSDWCFLTSFLSLNPHLLLPSPKFSYFFRETSNLISMEMKTCFGKKIKILKNNMTIEVKINRIESDQNFSSVSQPLSSLPLLLPLNVINTHEITFPNLRISQINIHIQLEPVPSSFFAYPLFVLVGSNPPTKDQYDKMYVMRRDDLSLHLTLEKKSFVAILYQSHEVTSSEEDFYVKERSYRFQTWTPLCGTIQSEWPGENCHVEKADLGEGSVSCRCSKMSDFFASFYYFSSNFSSSPALTQPITKSLNFMTLFLSLLLIILFGFFGWLGAKLDRKDARTSGIIHLCDNNPQHKQQYRVIVETGLRAGAGTSAKVSIVLHGKQGMSETRELTTQPPYSSIPSQGTLPTITTTNSTSSSPPNSQKKFKQILFQRNSRDTFHMTFPEPLGPIFKVQVWHNNSGESPSWYLNRITVHDICTGEVFYFVFEKWFAVEKGDGKVEREVLTSEKGLGFFKLLKCKGTQYLVDLHLWVSLFFKPRHSRFSRLQRIGCCFCIISSYMAANSFAYYFYGNQQLKYKPIKMTLGLRFKEIAVGILSSICLFPIHIFFQFLFRRCMVLQSSRNVFGAKKDISVSPEEIISREQQALEKDNKSEIHWLSYNFFESAVFSWRMLQSWLWNKRLQLEDSSPNPLSIHPPVEMTISPENLNPPMGTLPPLTPTLPNIFENQVNQDPGLIYNTYFKSENPSLALNSEILLKNSFYSPCFTSNKKLAFTCSNSSSIKSEFSEPKKPPLKNKRTFLPLFSRPLIWFLLLFFSFSSIVLSIYLNINFEMEAWFLWLESLFFSLLQSIFFNQPFLVLVISLLTAFRYRNSMLIFDHHRDGVINLTPPKSKPSQQSLPTSQEVPSLTDVDQSIVARQRSRYLRLARPPQEQKLIEARHLTMKQTNAKAFIKEAIVLFIQLLIVGVVSFGSSSSQNSVYLRKFFEEQFITPTFGPSFTNVSNLRCWDNWFNLVFQPTFHQLLQNHNFILIGGLKLRQLKVEKKDCQPIKNQFIPVTSCLPLFSHASVFKKNLFNNFTFNSTLNDSWVQKKFRPLAFNPFSFLFNYRCYKVNEHFDIKMKEKPVDLEEDNWRYKTKTKFSGYRGTFGSYSGEGYVVDLLKLNLTFPLKHLHKVEWINWQTTVLLLSFTFFHPPSNLFISTLLVSEMPSIGRIFSSFRISPVGVYKYLSIWDHIIFASELLFFLISLVRLHSIFYNLLHRSPKSILNFWNILKIILSAISLIFIICYSFRYNILTDALTNLLTAFYQNSEVDVFSVDDWEQVLRTLQSLILLLLCLFGLRLLHHHKPFASFFTVVSHSLVDLVVLCCILFIWLGAFISCGIVIFGSFRSQFCNFGYSLVQAMSLISFASRLSSPDHTVDPGDSNLIWIGLHAFFGCMGLMLIISYAKSFILFNFRIFKEEPKLLFSTKDHISFYIKSLKKLLRLNQENQEVEDNQQEDNNQILPEFTMAEVENQVDEVLFKMDSLLNHSNLKPKQPCFTESDNSHSNHSNIVFDAGLSVVDESNKTTTTDLKTLLESDRF